MTIDSLRILIIDDSPEDQEIMQRLLQNGSQERFRFNTAETGAAGLRACLDSETGLPDCILLDFHLPDYDAPEFLTALGAPELLVCPVVVVTGIAGGLDGPNMIQKGAQDFISKTWMNPESLVRVVENAIERYRLFRTLRNNEQQLLDILNVSPIAIRITHNQGSELAFFNPTYGNLFKNVVHMNDNPIKIL